MLVYKCRNCGGVLLVHPSGEKGRKQGIPAPSEVAGRFGYACPYCGSRITGLMNPDWREHIRVRPRIKRAGPGK